VCFRVAPFGAPRVKAVKKERKLYLHDWSAVPDPGPCFENLVAAQLLKHCHFLEDTQGYRMELRYLRDTSKRELDSVVMQGRKPLFAVEWKLSERDVAPAVSYFAERAGIPRIYQVHLDRAHYSRGKVTVIPFPTLCTELNLP
jgi:predicted AAA+ superfamily ATPase